MGWKAEGEKGAVSAGAPSSVAAGLEILQREGNAADAAVATILALSVTDYGRFAIGGEVPFLYYDAKSQRVEVLNGVGVAPKDPEAIAWLYAHGIPRQGVRAATVPAVVALCVAVLQRHGSMTFAEVVAPTLRLLESGEQEWYPLLLRTLRRLVEAERSASGNRRERLQAVHDRFYRGDIANELDAWYRSAGGFLRKHDLETYAVRVEEPVTTNYRGVTVVKCPPWTQGPSLLQTLRLLEGFDLKGMGHLSADYIHVVVEALKLALADRDAYYGDPEFVAVPMEALLSDEYTALRRALIDRTRASDEVRPGDPYHLLPLRKGGGFAPAPEGTTTCCVADRWGNVVAATPSANSVADGGSTGVAHGTRLSSLNTTPHHPNRLEAGKHPRVTLTPTLVLREGAPYMAISVAGGDLQDQTTLNVLLNVLEFGMSPAEAVTAPRFCTRHHEDSFHPGTHRSETYVALQSLFLNEAIPQSVRDELSRRGHRISTTSDRIADPSMILLDGSRFFAAGDPRAGRHAAAF